MSFTKFYGQYQTEHPIDEAINAVLKDLGGSVVTRLNWLSSISANITQLDATWVDKGMPKLNADYYASDFMQALQVKAGLSGPSYSAIYGQYPNNKPINTTAQNLVNYGFATSLPAHIQNYLSLAGLIVQLGTSLYDVSTASSAVCAMTLGSTVTVPKGALIADTTTGTQWALATAVTSTTAGSYNGTFKSVTLGPVPAAIGSLTTIVSTESGFTAVTNAAVATLGNQGYVDLNNPKVNYDYYIADLIQMLAVFGGI